MKQKIKISFMIKISLFLFAVMIFGFGINGCSEDPTPSLFNTDYVSKPQPLIDSLRYPGAYALATADIITIYGKNFSNVLAENSVMFNGIRGSVVTASDKVLTVLSPNIASDSVGVFVQVTGAEKFSNKFQMQLKPALTELKSIINKSFEETYGLTMDAAGNLYFSLVNTNIGRGIYKWDLVGEKQEFSPDNLKVTKYNNMKVGPGGDIYCVRNDPRIIKVPAAGGNATNWVTSGLSSVSLADLDFDKNQYMWTGGKGNFFIRVAQDKTTKTYPLVATVRGVKIYNDYVYICGLKDSLEGVWRAPIQSNDIGAWEHVVLLKDISNYTSSVCYSINLSKDGDIYIGTDNANAILFISKDRSVKEPFLKGLLKPNTLSMTWDKNNFMYYSKGKTAVDSAGLFKIDMKKSGAPQYGRGDN